MNAYIIVEGDKTELSVYPAWMSIIAPNMHQLEHAEDLTDDSYYLFSGQGQPSVFQHVAGAIKDINAINASGVHKYDFLLVCVDTEDESREYIEQQIDKYNQQEGVMLTDAQLVIFEQKVCMETWFIGNRRVLKQILREMLWFNISATTMLGSTIPKRWEHMMRSDSPRRNFTSAISRRC